MNKRARGMVAFAGVALGLASAHCSTGSLTIINGVDGSAPPGSPPLQHRAAAVTCSHDRSPGYNAPPPPPGSPDAGLPASYGCSSDAQCTDATKGSNGRCTQSRITDCTYDGCFADADCGGSVCQCGVAGGTQRAGHSCVKGNCRVDAECGTGGYCSPTFDFGCGSFSGIVGYYCHSAKDGCRNDSDCSGSGPKGQGDGYCAYNPTVAQWAWRTRIAPGELSWGTRASTTLRSP